MVDDFTSDIPFSHSVSQTIVLFYFESETEPAEYLCNMKSCRNFVSLVENYIGYDTG